MKTFSHPFVIGLIGTNCPSFAVICLSAFVVEYRRIALRPELDVLLSQEPKRWVSRCERRYMTMGLNSELVTAIRARRSVRSYRNEPLSPDDESFLRALVDELSEAEGPSGTRLRLLLSTELELSGKVGTYGVIMGARSYVGAVTTNTPGSMLDLGYLFERMVIELTARGLGTCWLGGTFDRKSFAAGADLAPGEILPIITPVGYPAERSGLQDRFMRTMAGSDRRKPFGELFFDGGFDRPHAAAGSWANALELVRIGPSASNKQPWRVVLAPAGAASPTAAHIYLARTPGYIGTKLGFDIQRIDIGIAMYHLQAAMSASGHHGRWQFADPGIDPDSDIAPPSPPDEHTEYVATYL